MQKLLLLLTFSSLISFSQTSVKKCEEKFNASIIKAAKKVSNLYEKKIEEAVAADNQQEAERLMKELQDHKQKVKTIVKSARYNPGVSNSRIKTPVDINKVIKFKDKALEKLVRTHFKLDDGPIKVSDVNQVKIFEQLVNYDDPNHENRDETIKDISALKYFTSLESLALMYHEISDISVLEELPNLQRIAFNYNKISDISVVANLKKLTSLSVPGNKIKSLEGIEELPELYLLNLYDNKINNLTPLTKWSQNKAIQRNARFGRVRIEDNNLPLREGSKDRVILDALIKKGVNVQWKQGNKY